MEVKRNEENTWCKLKFTSFWKTRKTRLKDQRVLFFLFSVTTEGPQGTVLCYLTREHGQLSSRSMEYCWIIFREQWILWSESFKEQVRSWNNQGIKNPWDQGNKYPPWEALVTVFTQKPFWRCEFYFAIKSMKLLGIWKEQ